MPAWFYYIVENGTIEQAARVAQFCGKVFGLKYRNKPDIAGSRGDAVAGIRLFHSWLGSSIRMPTTLEKLGIPNEDVPAMVKRTADANNGKIVGFMELDEKAIGAIYTSMIGGK
jgi:alcohol dehydrogenase YqhD (iron-dependent ADH family)